MTQLTTLVALACLATTPALAETPGTGARADRAFERMDTDGDGVITVAEVTARKTAQFAKVDTNADGLLDATERDAMRGDDHHRARRTGGMGHGPRGDAAPLDADGDGKLSLVEFTSVTPLLDRADADDDGAVSRAEFDAAIAARHN